MGTKWDEDQLCPIVSCRCVAPKMVGCLGCAPLDEIFEVYLPYKWVSRTGRSRKRGKVSHEYLKIH